jgi:hypothetical protein
MLLSELVPLVDAHQGVIYQMDGEGAHLNLLAAYANAEDEGGYPQRLRSAAASSASARSRSAAS